MTLLLVDYILYIRTIAFYSQNKKLVVILGIAFAFEAILMLVSSIYSLIYEKIDYFGLAEGLTMCGLQRDVPKIWPNLFWTAPLAFESVLMILALYKAAEFWKTKKGFSEFDLVKVLIQEQVIYFLLVIACSATKITALTISTNLLSATVLFEVLGSANLLCVLGSWLLVHLKEAVERDTNGGQSYRLDAVSDIIFE
ncbi:hypothetical protein EW145_g5573 [Phellinidium pouzarii]|uniref:Uncharacterized protein n=1 Tax=Phellinidium pouzarii TaxID=167371 RepID=A0A4S4KZN3_9AGAM|nr:hypothetical protein EW145_g5573 [Phellinidium pouzarii]